MTDEGRLGVQGPPCMQVLAHAKINLSLEVLGRREDGYHQVMTVLHTVDLVDRLTFEPSRSLGLQCEQFPVQEEQNIVMRAARLLQQRAGSNRGAAITLEKGIPIASGLGGGSSDAAATLKTLNGFWDVSLSRAELRDLAAHLGSDVPFFLEGGCALAEGRGEVVTGLPSVAGLWAVILVPPFQLEDKTARLYGLLANEDFTDGSATRKLAERLRTGATSVDEVGTGGNAFKRVAGLAFPGLEEEEAALLGAGARFVRVAGSGPALYTLTDSKDDGLGIAGQLEEIGRRAYLTKLSDTG